MTAATLRPAIPPQMLRGVDLDIRVVLTSDNEALAGALNTLPEHGAITARLAAMAVLESELRGAVRESDATAAELADQFLDRLGSTNPPTAAELDAAAHTVALSGTVRQVRAEVLESLRGRVTSDADTFVRTSVDPIRRHLHRQLTDLIDEVKDDALHEVADPAVAINTGRVDDHQRFSELAAAYEQIRAAQLLIDKAALGARTVSSATSPHYATARHLHGASKLWPGYGRWARAGRPSSQEEAFTIPGLLPPWPADLNGPAAPVLAWIATSGATAWVPTGAELAAEQSTLAAAHRQATLDEHDNKASSEGKQRRNSWDL